jgi:hypothetical protein
MKNIKYIVLGFCLLLGACDLINPLKDDLSSVKNGITQEFEYTLTDDDFTVIAKRALYLNSADTVNVSFLKKYKYFTDEAPAATYVPLLLDENFPMYQSGSQAKISYLYNGEMPEDLSAYTEAKSYTFTPDDYQLANQAVLDAGYFSPRFSPEKYIPKIIKQNIDSVSSGDYYTISYKYSDVDPQIDYSAYEISPVWEEGFATLTDLSNFQVISATGNQKWTWASSNEGVVTMDGWDNVNNPNEDWLISAKIDLTNSSNTYMQLSHAVEYFETGCLFILVSTNYDGTNYSSAKWKEIPFPDYTGSNKNKYVETNAIDISAYDGKKINIAFKYVSTSVNAPYWGIGNVKVGPYGYKVTGASPYTVEDFYQYNSTDWTKMSGVYKLNSADYEKMGLSTYYLSGSKATLDYLPTFAAKQNPYAKDGTAIIYVYSFYDGTETITLADKLTKTDGVWISSFNYIRTVSEPYASTVSGWVFDPTIVFTMDKVDYATIATYVKNDPILSKLDNNTFTDSEYYYGASGYYGNFDTRSGKFYSGFASWQDAVEEAIGKVLLPAKYPNAEAQYKGIDMQYVVHFIAYGATPSNYYMKFQCTKSAPDPEFVLVDGPVAE